MVCMRPCLWNVCRACHRRCEVTCLPNYMRPHLAESVTTGCQARTVIYAAKVTYRSCHSTASSERIPDIQMAWPWVLIADC